MKTFLKWLAILVFCGIVVVVVSETIIQTQNRKEQEKNLSEKNTQTFAKYDALYDLQFSSYPEAVMYFKEVSGKDSIWFFSFYEQEKVGKIFLRSRIESKSGNRCVDGLLDLTTKEWMTREDACIRTMN